MDRQSLESLNYTGIGSSSTPPLELDFGPAKYMSDGNSLQLDDFDSDHTEEEAKSDGNSPQLDDFDSDHAEEEAKSDGNSPQLNDFDSDNAEEEASGHCDQYPDPGVSRVSSVSDIEAEGPDRKSVV